MLSPHTRSSSSPVHVPSITCNQEQTTIRHPLQLIRQIGVGSGGSVYLGRLLSGPNRDSLVAIKRSNRKSLERRALELLKDCPMIVKMVGWLPLGPSEPNTVLLMLEYVDGWELFDLINQGNLTDPQISSIFWQLVDCLECIHSRGLIHGDLKPENIMILPDFSLKLIDFGMCRLKTDTCRGLWGSVEYAPPEMTTCESSYDPEKAEMWSLGVVLFTMVHRQLPVDCGLHNCDSCSAFQPIISALLVDDPQQRPSCALLKQRFA